MSSPDINYPQQPTYGEGMADAMQAQMQMLLGTGEFADIYSDAGFEGGDLATIMREVEAPLRQQTAQVDTDVLRQTLLGTEKQMKVQQDPDTGKFGIAGAEAVTDADGNAQTAGGGRYQMVKINDGQQPVATTGLNPNMNMPGVTPVYAIIDTETGGVTERSGGEYFLRPGMVVDSLFTTTNPNERVRNVDAETPLFELGTKSASSSIRTLQQTIDDAGGDPDAVAQEFTFTNPNIPTDASKAGQPGFDDKGNRLLEGGQNVAEQTITVREGDGMVDLLGDRREIQGQVSDFKGYIENNADLAQAFTDARQAGDTRTIEEFGRDHYEAQGKAEGRELPTTFGDIGRQAGFSETGEFLGASALAEDIQAGNLSRQRERDISDVERLSGRFQNIMEDYRPAAATGISDAKLLLTQQRENLTGLREATQADVDAGNATKLGEMIQTGTGSGVISMPDKIGTRQATQGDVDLGLAANVGDVIQPYSLSGDAAIGQGVGGEDTLRSALLADARGALSDGLTDREKARISEAFKGQSTMMGRTFDQSAGIAEAQAQTLEDRNRQMQNRAFAQSALGQEAGLQTSDATKAMTTDQFNIGAQMDAERLNEELRQRGLANYIGAVGNLAAIEDQYTLDPFAAILGRGGGGSLQAGQGVFSQAGYGLQSGPQYLNPGSGLGYISQMAANNATMYAADQAAQGSFTDGLLSFGGNVGGPVTKQILKKF